MAAPGAAITLESLEQKDDNNAYKASISSKGGNTSNMQKHLCTQHAITLHERHVLDPLRSDVSGTAAALMLTLARLLLFILKVKLDTAYHVSSSFIIKPAITNC